jgi:CHAT domain-containing protein/tetratricopeptide (TPR) repeat protein
LIRKIASRSFSALVLSAVLLIASPSLLCAQGDSSGSKRQSPQAANQAEELFQNALLLFDTQKDDSARLRLQEAMRLWMQMREPGKAAKAALQVGDRYKQARQYQQALDYYQQALKVKLLPGAVKANALNAIALLYADLYLHDLAAHYFKRALDQGRRINDLPAQILALTGLANLYHRQGVLEKALAYITQALRLSKKDQADADPALLYLMGQVSQEQGLVEKAKGAFEEALAIYRNTGNVAGQVKVWCALSTLSLLASQKQAALEQAVQAVELAEKLAKHVVSDADEVNARELQWRAWLSRARAAYALEQKEYSLKSYSRAINHFEGLWWTVFMATEASAIAFREEAQAAYREYVDLLMEQEQFKKAYKLADEAKARTALNFTGARRATRPSEDSKLTATLGEQSQSIARLRLQPLAPNLSREQQAKLQKEIEEAEYQRQETQVLAEMKHSRERLVWTKLVTAEELQKKMAKDQMALAEFSLGENRSFVWLFTHGELFFEILPARKDIEKVVKAYLDILAAPPDPLQLEKNLAKLRPQAEALFAKLFGGLSRHLKPGQPLIVVPDGLLHYLPFETLIHNGRYLVEDHEITYNPSASMLGLLQESQNLVESGDRMELLAIGDVVFDATAKTTGGKESPDGLSKRARQMLAARGFRLAQLPRTRDEILDIAGFFPADRRKVLMERESTEEAFKREPLRRYRRLHFATHSLMDEKSPMRSAVVLTPGDNMEEDGLLEVSEISRLDLDCDLVVVSACQTGRGQLLSGEGIVGLSRAFLYAGARSVVVSLWNVSDISTGQLMKNFYQNLIAGQSNAAALRKAKLQMLSRGKVTCHPYYWSSFVLVGKP